MDTEKLYSVVRKIFAPGKGILAADESNKTADKRLISINAEIGEENRRKYRDLFINTPHMEDFVSGIILYDETIRQTDPDGKLFTDTLKEKGVVIGIKVDTGTEEIESYEPELKTVGLGGLPERVKEYADMGAQFAKWRCVIQIGENIPSDKCLQENALGLVEYAKICQKGGLVPIIEPEVLLEGEHDIEKAEEVTEKTLKTVFEHIKNSEVDLSALILKTSMVVPGNKSGQTIDSKTVAQRTIEVLKKVVPADIGGVVFLSGGQEADEATIHLNDMAKMEPLPFEIAFSYARAIQGPAINIWQGKDENIEKSREEFLNRLKLNSLADQGKL